MYMHLNLKLNFALHLSTLAIQLLKSSVALGQNYHHNKMSLIGLHLKWQTYM